MNLLSVIAALVSLVLLSDCLAADRSELESKQHAPRLLLMPPLDIQVQEKSLKAHVTENTLEIRDTRGPTPIFVSAKKERGSTFDFEIRLGMELFAFPTTGATSFYVTVDEINTPFKFQRFIEKLHRAMMRYLGAESADWLCIEIEDNKLSALLTDDYLDIEDWRGRLAIEVIGKRVEDAFVYHIFDFVQHGQKYFKIDVAEINTPEKFRQFIENVHRLMHKRRCAAKKTQTPVCVVPEADDFVFIEAPGSTDDDWVTDF